MLPLLLSAFSLLWPCAPSGAQALDELKALAGAPERSAAAYDGGQAVAEAPPPPPAAANASLKPAKLAPPPKDEPATPAEAAAVTRGKVWGGILGGLVGAATGGPLVYALWGTAVPWLGVVLAVACVVGAVFIGMDVGKHLALDEARGL